MPDKSVTPPARNAWAPPMLALEEPMPMRLAALAALPILILAAAPIHVRAQPAPAAPYAHAIVVAAEPDAAAAGVKVLRAGGSAVDAAVAVQAVLGLEEPQSSGLGGGAFMLYYDARSGRTTVYNGREKAPAAATPQLFFGPDGKQLDFITALMSGRSTGVPGAVAMLALAHKEHGKRPWSSLFDDAARLADQGFVVPKRMGAAMNLTFFPQTRTPDAVAYFTKPGGGRYQGGETMRNAAYAATLRAIAVQGPGALYAGKIAADIVAKVHEGALPGALTADDLAAYRPEEGPALCRPHHEVVVCSAPPPSGGVGVLELLGILEHTDIAASGPTDPKAWRTFVQASRLMYADRDYYEGDPDFVKNVPVAGLLDPAYDAARAKLVGGTGVPSPGDPPGGPGHGADATVESEGTTHFVIIDAAGDVVSMTTTVESLFGSGRMVDGFFLNNQLTDFSFSPTQPDGRPAANAPAGGKRPRSSMSPIIVFDRRGKVVAAVGSPGGNSIVAYVGKALVGFIDWRLPLQGAVALPNLVGRGRAMSVEKGAEATIVDYLKASGLPVRSGAGENSGLNGVTVTKAGYVGATDPRREAEAIGY
jgi:gamma-glutamyltranspeptidase/glutathione hydrolase